MCAFENFYFKPGLSSTLIATYINVNNSKIYLVTMHKYNYRTEYIKNFNVN